MTNVISVRFRGGCKTYYFDPHGLTVNEGDFVIVETAQGLEYAQCAMSCHDVPDAEVVQPLRPIVRLATENDRRMAEYNRGREKEAFATCQKKIVAHGLDMKLVRVECNFEGNKIIFFFTADGRVDFRELVKDLASVFRARIELRQIGVRDEAKMLGGLGICGRPFCCAEFMDEFMPVSIKMAKTQSLSLNPTKISGTCGRLMCCLKYEQDAYEDAVRRMPKNDSFVQTPDGVGNVSDLNLLKEKVTVRLDNQPEAPKCYHNCEVCVLRNGKGSRDGIVIPEKAPERYVAPLADDEEVMPTVISEMLTEPPAVSVPVEEKRRRRNRGGRRGGKRPEGAGGDAPAAAKVAVKPMPKKAPEDGQAPATRKPRRHSRGRRGGKSGAPKAES
ncbi:MAG: stage 0 sporulation family protein [Clostridiales bacterium]|nr:stage 0 sporulation family protein [Clostridiales bacterium]